MRILVDGAAFQNDYQRGVQRCFRELLIRVSRTIPVDFFLSAPAKGDLPEGCQILQRKEWFPVHRANLPARIFNKLRREFAPTRFTGHTIFHSSFFSLSPEPGVPEVLTVHDMVAERFRQLFRIPRESQIAEKLRCMESAAKILCISHATAADVTAIYPQFKDKLCVVHHGADHFLASSVTQSAETRAISLPEKFLLFVGDRDGYKNFYAVVTAMSEASWPQEMQLVAVGGQTTPDENRFIQKHGLQNKIHFTGYVPDNQLQQYYRQSAGLIFPSLGEGFGFPLLEAQSLKVPVLCSDLPVFREVGGDSPIKFDPENPASIASAAANLLNAATEKLTDAGHQNVHRFRWDECARQTIKVYHSASSPTA